MSVFVVALAAEARPLIDALKLKREIDSPWQYYKHEDNHLLLTGIGKINAAAACGWLIGAKPELSRSPWINIGIAGHATAELGSLFWVERLKAPKIDLYPALHVRHPIAGARLQTVDAPCTDYTDAQLVDMEGLAFYQSCSRFVPLELLHILKVVSDNREHSLEQLNKEKVTGLIAANVEQIINFSERLSTLAKSLPEDTPHNLQDTLGQFHGEWRFSHNQKLQLEKLQMRHYALTDSIFAIHDFETKPRDSKQALAILDTIITSLPVTMQ